MRNMRNPFEYGGVVDRGAFCNREREKADLRRAIENREKLFVFAERRLGKTSLVQQVLGELPSKGYVCAYVDLWPTDSEATFVTALAKAITTAMSHSVANLLETAKKFFGTLAPSVTINQEGRPELSFGVSRQARPGPALDEVLATPAEVARDGRRRVVVVFDEFQQILDYESDQVERKLRSAVQTQRDVACLFLGSRKHLIQKMFMDRSRPLYRAGGHYPLGPIAEDHWVPFIGKRFAAADKAIRPEAIHSIWTLTHGHPFYTQHLCHALWELCEPKKEVTEELIRAAVRVLLLCLHRALGFSGREPEEIPEGPRRRAARRPGLRRRICPAVWAGVRLQRTARGRRAGPKGRDWPRKWLLRHHGPIPQIVDSIHP